MSCLLFPSFGLEAVIVPPKSRFRVFEFDTELVGPRTLLGPGPNYRARMERLFFWFWMLRAVPEGHGHRGTESKLRVG